MDANLNMSDVDYQGMADDTTDVTHDRQLTLRLILMTFGYPLLAVGTAAHVLLALACFLSKMLHDSPLRVFILVRSACGIATLYSTLLMWIIYYQTYGKVYFLDQTTELGCRLYAAVLEFLLQFFAWMEAGVALERVAAVRWPHLLHSRLTTRNCAIGVAVAGAALAALCIVPFCAYGYLSATCIVTYPELYYRVWLHVRGLVCLVLPTAVIAACGAMTLHALLHPPAKLADGDPKAKLVTVSALSLNAIFVVTSFPIAVSEWHFPYVAESDAVESVTTATFLFYHLGGALSLVVCATAAIKWRKAGRTVAAAA